MLSAACCFNWIYRCQHVLLVLSHASCVEGRGQRRCVVQVAAMNATPLCCIMFGACAPNDAQILIDCHASRNLFYGASNRSGSSFAPTWGGFCPSHGQPGKPQEARSSGGVAKLLSPTRSSNRRFPKISCRAPTRICAITTSNSPYATPIRPSLAYALARWVRRTARCAIK